MLESYIKIFYEKEEEMSLVQAYISENFILVCGEQKAILSNGIVIDDFVKIRKINNTTIIGMTGTIEGNFELFSDYINNDFSLKTLPHPSNYSDIENKIINNFNNKFDYLQKNRVISFICGWDGYRMTGKTFFTNLEHPINDLAPEYPGHVRIVNCGLDEHEKNAKKIARNKNPQNLMQYKNLFKDVIDEGIKFDNTINKSINFERIRRIDVEK